MSKFLWKQKTSIDFWWRWCDNIIARADVNATNSNGILNNFGCICGFLNDKNYAGHWIQIMWENFDFWSLASEICS